MDTCGVSAESASIRIWVLCKLSAHGQTGANESQSLDCSGASFRHCAYHLSMEACGQYQLRAIFVLDGSTIGLTSFWCGKPAVAVDAVPAMSWGLWANDDAAPGRSYPGG